MSDTLLDAPVATEREDGQDEWLLAWALLLLLLGANAARPLTGTQRRRARDLLRTRFENAALRNALRVSEGIIDVDTWQVAVTEDITGYTRQMAIAGAGTLPNATVREMAEAEIQRQMPFLAGFAVAVAAGGLSIMQIAARNRLYGASGWALHWQAQESAIDRQRGTIVHYRARDDKGTCSPCHQAQARGPYAAGSNHPVPGSVCRGGGLCRCELVFEFNPEAHARLAR